MIIIETFERGGHAASTAMSEDATKANHSSPHHMPADIYHRRRSPGHVRRRQTPGLASSFPARLVDLRGQHRNARDHESSHTIGVVFLRIRKVHRRGRNPADGIVKSP